MITQIFVRFDARKFKNHKLLLDFFAIFYTTLESLYADAELKIKADVGHSGNTRIMLQSDFESLSNDARDLAIIEAEIKAETNAINGIFEQIAINEGFWRKGA